MLQKLKPIHINQYCKLCRTSLVPVDDLWPDEWICPHCNNDIYLDWTNEDFKHIEKFLE